jgi:predicted ArsR family transcriptional regulator
MSTVSIAPPCDRLRPMTEQQRLDLAAIGLLDEPVRRELYEWVSAQAGPVGRERAARAVGVSRALATFHLDKLADAGLLDASYMRLSGKVGPGAGRPARVYRRAAREFRVSLPDRRYERAASLFASALERLGDGRPPRALTRAARALGSSMGHGQRRGSPRTRVLRALDAGGYEPATQPDGTIRLRNCPYDALVDEHRTLVCGTNLALAQGLLDGAGAEGLVPVLDAQPGFCCVTFRERPA